MRILQFYAENIKKISVVQITPDGSVVQITGPNDTGKSSVLDAIEWCLCGGRTIQGMPVRRGAEKAKIKLDIGDGGKVEVVVERRFTAAGGDTLIVTNVDGLRYPTPQKFLDTLWGAVSFDPLGFLQEKPLVQAEILRGLVKLEVDVDALDKQNAEDAKERTAVNRELAAAQAKAQGIAVPDGTPEAQVDEAAIVTELQAAVESNQQLERRIEADVRAAKRSGELLQEAAEIALHLAAYIANLDRMHQDLLADFDQQIALLERRKKAVAEDFDARSADAGAKAMIDTAAKTAEANAIVAKIPAGYPEAISVHEIKGRLDAARATNLQVALLHRRQEHEIDAKNADAKSTALTTAIKARETQKAEALAKAEMPVPGLGFADGVVTLNGIPFDQAATAQQIRVSMAIAMAANPKLRVVRIKEGSLLDEANLGLIAQMAAEKDYQVWLERVSDTGDVGIVMEDGHVKGKPPAAEPEVDPNQGQLV